MVAPDRAGPRRAAPGSEVLGRLAVRLDPGWHLYSLTTPRPPIATTITLAGDAPSQGLKAGAPAGALELTAQVRYRLCDDKQCLPPVRRTAAATITVDPAPRIAAAALPAGYTEVQPKAANTPPAKPAGGQGILRFLLAAVGFGLAAIFTPCVFPMIPITMSFFLNRPERGRGAGIRFLPRDHHSVLAPGPGGNCGAGAARSCTVRFKSIG